MQVRSEIVSNEPLTGQVWRMQLRGEKTDFRPGQFVEIQLPSFFLRRPISVCDAETIAKDGQKMTLLTLVYKVVGGGTKEMSQLPVGTGLDVLAPLGNGYDLSRAGEHPLLIGGGVGIPPLYLLARQLRAAGKNVQVVLGFNTASEAFYIREFEALGCTVYVTTADGSLGTKGFVTDVIPRILEQKDGYPYYYACGPLPMLRSVVRLLGTNGEISMEERMGCGFGVCMGCSIQTASGAKRVCTEGPVFKAGELLL